MSRLLGIGFILCDLAATAASMLAYSGALICLVLSVCTSFLIALSSSTVRSLLYPTYFWDSEEAGSRTINR